MSLLFDLKNEAGAATLENVLSEITKLERIRALSLPSDLFSDVSRKRILWCKQRIVVEDLSEIRRHPAGVRYTWVQSHKGTKPAMKKQPDTYRSSQFLVL